MLTLGWASPKPHQCHFRGQPSTDPAIYDPSRSTGTPVPSGNGTTTTGDEVAIDGNYTIHLRNPVPPG